MKQDLNREFSRWSFSRAIFVGLILLAMAKAASAQATLRVPQDFPTIQLAVNSANSGDTVQVGPGRWCGARITKPLNLVGEGATIMGCPAGTPGPVGNVYRTGFFLNIAASGSSISHFVFDGKGISDTNLSPLALGINSQMFTNNVVVDSNTFLGGLGGIQWAGGNGWVVTHNVFSGYTILSSGAGGFGILSEDFQSGPFSANVYLHNQFTTTVPPGSYSFASIINEVDVPVAGIVIAGQSGTIIAHNKISITPNASGDAGAGIIATDATIDGQSSTTTNLVIVDNDGRGSQYCLIITKDQNGGTGNSVGATLWGNFGVNLIDGSTSVVRNRSIRTLKICDPSGVCE
jgi:hypothetical protein